MFRYFVVILLLCFQVTVSYTQNTDSLGTIFFIGEHSTGVTDIYAFDLESGALRILTENDKTENNFDISPDCDAIAYLGSNSSALNPNETITGLYTLNLANKSENFINLASPNTYMSWQDFGFFSDEHIFFQDGIESKIYRFSTKQTYIPDSINYIHDRMSQDGRYVAVADQGNQQFKLISAITGEQIFVIPNLYVQRVYWSPDSTKYVLMVGRDFPSETELYLGQISSDELTLVRAGSDTLNTFQSWSPDSSSFVYYSAPTSTENNFVNFGRRIMVGFAVDAKRSFAISENNIEFLTSVYTSSGVIGSYVENGVTNIDYIGRSLGSSPLISLPSIQVSVMKWRSCSLSSTVASATSNNNQFIDNPTNIRTFDTNEVNDRIAAISSDRQEIFFYRYGDIPIFREDTELAQVDFVSFPIGSRNLLDISWSDDGNSIAVVNGDNLYIVDPTTGIIAEIIDLGVSVTEVEWAPNSQYLAVRSDFTVFIIDSFRVELLYEKSLFELESFTWGNNSNQIAFGDTNGDVFIWDFQTNSVADISGTREHGDTILALDWHPFESLLATAGWVFDNKIFIWNTATQQFSHASQELEAFTDIEWSPDGRLLASHAQRGPIRLWATNVTQLETIGGIDSVDIAWSFKSDVVFAAGPNGLIGFRVPTIVTSSTQNQQTETQQVPTSSDTRISGRVTATYLNTRSGPGPEYAEVIKLNNGNIITAIGRNSDATWIQIEGSQSWVNASYIQLNSNIMSLPITFQELGDWLPAGQLLGIQGRATTTIRLRGGPGTSYQQLRNPDILEEGEIVEIVGRDTGGEWFRVNIGNRSAWVSSSYIQLTRGSYTSIPISN